MPGRSTAYHRLTATAAARWAALAPLLAALAVAALAPTPLGGPHTALSLLLAAATTALVAGAAGVVAVLAFVLLLGATAPRPAPSFVTAPSSRQQDPTTPGRPQPRAPGATSLPCAR